MRKFMLAFSAGVLGGIAAAIAALYYSPLSTPAGRPPTAGDWMLAYGLPSVDGIAFTHGGQAPMPRYPAGVAELWEDPIRRTALAVLPLSGQGGGGPVSVASRISVPSERSEPVLEGFVVRDHWLVTVPGEGSFFVLADANWWSFLRRTLIPVRYLGRPWQGPEDYYPTSGPGPDGAGRLVGAGGRFEGATGRAVETYRLEQFTPEAGPERLRALLAVSFEAGAPPPPAGGGEAAGPDPEAGTP